VRLDPRILQDLAVQFAPKAYVRVTPLARAATPLGMGHGDTRFASPTQAFKVLYLGQTLLTAVAETIVRDRFQARVRRVLEESEIALWGATTVSAAQPLTLIDLRTTGLVRLGVSTEAARGKAHGQGRQLSQAVHDQTDADGLLYASRLTGAICVCVYERGAPSLQATPVTPVSAFPDFTTALQALDITLARAP
jgi:RES domain